jgi:hypothetical protein
MKALPLLVLLSTACTRGPVVSPTSPQRQDAPTCSLRSVAHPLYRSLTSAEQALQDFKRQTGTPYAALYLAVPTNHSAQSQCIRLVQRAPHRFMRYCYLPRLDSTVLFDSTCQTRLARLPTGYFVNLCMASWTDPFFEVVLVKHDTTTQFSLYLENGPRQTFSPLDEARIARVREVIRRISP